MTQDQTSKPIEYASPETTGRARVMTFLEPLFPVLALVAVVIGFTALNGTSFLSAGNIENIAMQSAVYAMAGIGMTMIMITGGIDLAAGSTIALSMVVTSMVLKRGVADDPGLYTPLAVVAAAATGMCVGIVQGTLITALRVVPFIITLAGFVSIRGFAKYIADNQEVNPPANWLYQNLMFPVQGIKFSWQLFPLGVWATLFAAILAALFMRFTRLGRHIYAVGSNESTARLCGVNVPLTKTIVYAIGGAFAGLAGVLEFSKLNIGQPTGAAMYELYIIAACVIGGTSLRGGIGTIFGTVIGSVLIGVLYIGSQQAGWPKHTQEMVIGPIIITAVALNQIRTRRQAAT
jgi:erythritol transport system permease protein